MEQLPAVVGPDVEAAVNRLADGEVAMLENVRWEPGEEANDEAFVEKLTRLADLYVNDAFGTATAPTPPPRASPTISPRWPAT